MLNYYQDVKQVKPLTAVTKRIINGITIVMILLAFNVFSQGISKKAIIVSSYHQKFEVQRNMLQALQDNLAESITITTLYLDSKRTKGKALELKADKLLQQITAASVDIVFLCDDNAVKFLAEKLLRLSLNVVVLGINENPRYYVDSALFSKFKGVLERPLYLRAITELLPFYPLSTKVTVLMDDTVTSKVVHAKLFGRKESIKHGNITVNYKKITDIQALKAFVDAKNNEVNHELFVTTLFKVIDRNINEVVASDDILRWLSRHYQKPIYSFWKTNVKEHFFLAAYGSSEESQGSKAAEIGKEILFGKRNISTFSTPRKDLFFVSEKQLTKHNLNVPNEIKSKEFITFK